MANNNSEIDSELRAVLLRRVNNLREAVASNTPDLLISMMVVSVWNTAFILMPEDLTDQKMQSDLTSARQSFAICACCGERRIECLLSHPVHCGECEARLDAENRKIQEDV